MRSQIRFSSILVSGSRGLRVYRSFDEVPGPVRQRIMTALNKGEGGTVVIADRRLRETEPQPASLPPPPPPSNRWDKRAILELIAAGVLGLAVWALATLR